MMETTWADRWNRREINRWDAEREAWESYVGSQSVQEFVRYFLDEGITDIDEMARRYVADIPSIWPEIRQEELPEDLAELLAGYIRRQIDSEARINDRAGVRPRPFDLAARARDFGP